MKKHISFFLAVLLIASLLVSPIMPLQGNVKVAHAATTIAIKAKLTTLEVGATTTLTVSGTKKKVSWSSSNKSYVSVDSKGKVKANKIGSATITAKVDNKKYTKKITVVEPTALNSNTLLLNVGKKDFIKVRGLYTAQTKVAKWDSSNKKVATVDSTGVINAVGVGTATISASIHGKTYNCKVTVKEKIAISNTTLSLQSGITQALSFKGISYRAVWSSSNTKVAYVSFDGKVTGIAEGTAVITGRVDGYDYHCTVNVTKPADISKSCSLVFVGDKTTKLPAPITTTDPIAWQSSNTSVATVTDGTLNALTAGNVTIRATVGTTSYTYFVVVIDKSNPYLKSAPFAAKEITFGKVHLVVPASWDNDSDYGDYDLPFYMATISPYKGSDSYIDLEIDNSARKEPGYYRTKNLLMREISEAQLVADINENQKDYGVDYKFLGSKQYTYMSTFGNILRSEVNYNLYGDIYKDVNYSFAIDNYTFSFDSEDIGDTPDFQKKLDYIVNSIYIQ